MVNRLITQLLASERFVAAVQEIASRAISARGAVDRGLRSALASMNLPSTADVDELRRRLDALDRLMTELHGKLERIDSKVSRPPRTRGEGS